MEMVICVRSSDENSSPSLQEAFEALTENGFRTEWMAPDECLQIKEKVRTMAFIFDPFVGEAFTHLCNLGFRILGPQCVLSSLYMKIELPKNFPVYNLAMKNLVVSCSCIDKSIREEIYKKVSLMAGSVSKEFTHYVTHLISGEVGSKKYQVAVELKKEIMSPEWVQAVWEKSRHRHVHASDELFNKYRCPIFKGFNISVSGLEPAERKEVRNLIESEGGVYSGEMKMNTCTHLVINHPTGTKYEFALKWKIKTVSSKWVYDSIESGYCLLEDDYRTDPVSSKKKSNQQTSTPTKNSANRMQESHINDISSICNYSSVTNVGETTMFQSNRQLASIQDQSVLNLDIDLNKTTKDLFLDGLKIYLSGFRNPNLDKLRKIINAGGATRFNNINEGVTHVVIGEAVDSDINLLKSGEYRPFALSAQWLIDCYNEEKHLDETNYLCLDLPAQQSNGTPVKSNKSRAKAKKDNHDSTLAAAAAVTGDFESDMDVLSQYLPVPNKTQNAETRLEEAENAPHHEEDEESQTQDQSTVLEGGIFAGKKFVFLGFEGGEQKELLEVVLEKGGIIIQQNQRIVADFGVVPVLGYPVNLSVTEVVTYAWVKMCLEEDSFLDIDSNALFRPIDIVSDMTPLDGCVLSVSGFAGTERSCIIELAETIGAKCQDCFVLRAKNGQEPCTHLVVNAPKGSKYEASVKWNIPAVDKSWIFTCARLGRQLPVDYFLIEKMFNAERIRREAMPEIESRNKDIPVKASGKKTATLNKETTSKNIPSLSTNNGDDDGNDDDDDDDDDDEIVFKEKEIKICIPPQNKSSLQSNDGMEEREPRVEKELRSSGEDKVPSSSAEEVKSDQKSDNLNPMSGILDRMKNRALQDNQMSNVNSPKHRIDNTNVNSPKHRTDNQNVNSPKPTVSNRNSELQKIGSPKQHIGNPRSHNSPKPQLTKTDPKAYNSPQLKHNRLQELKPGTPATPGTPASPDGTPSKFLKPGVVYDPKFDFSDLIKKYEAMDEANESLNVSDIFQQAVEYTSVAVDRCPTPLVTRKQSVVVKPLAGVTIYVSKKLSAKMSQFHDIVSDLGGDYQHKYTPRCTHVIFQGKANDVNKEFRKARDENKTIVSPYWLQACLEKNERVDEALYPHNYNPKLALNVLSSTPRTTPIRSQRTMSRATRANNSQQTTEGSAQVSNDIPVLNLKAHVDLDETEPQRKKLDGRKGERHSSDSDHKTSPVLRGRKGGKSSSSEGEKEQKSGDGEEDNKHEDVEMETGGTLEMKIAFSKQLDDMMNKSKKPGRKKSLKRLNSSGQLNASGNMSDNRPPSRQENWDKSEKRKTRSKGKNNEDYSGPTESQSVLVTWDDPVGRLEKEKLAAKLEQACSPTQTQNTDDCMAGLDMPADAQYSEVEESSSTDDDKKKRRSRDKRTPTPEAPSLAFPVNRKSSVTKPPQPVELLEEETAPEPIVAVKPNYVFLLSSMSNEERVEYGALIEELGGKLLDGQHFNTDVTHLVTGSPGRNEKFLACMASGKWILHKSYFEACRQQKKFASEELYEWGGEFTKSLRGINKTMLNLATAAHTWRQRIQEMKKNNESGGAFVGWKVVLYTDKAKEGNFSRLLKAGGAEVLPLKPPYLPDMSATHAFLELHKVPLDQSDLECLLRADVLCLKPDYIPLHLCDPSTPPDDYIPTEISALKASLPDINPSKRKFNVSNSSNKRSRKQ